MPVLYAAVPALLGTRVALLAALGLAASPLASAFSNFARGFALSRLGLLIALWAWAWLATGGEGRSWWLYTAGAIVAIWSEYDAVLFLFSLLAAMLLLRRDSGRKRCSLGKMALPTLKPRLEIRIRGSPVWCHRPSRRTTSQ